MEMASSGFRNRLRRLRNHYRLVVMNEDNFEEVVQFKINRLSVYIGLSTLFVVLVALTASLIIFTPLKYYLPGAGYGDAKQLKELRTLKMRTDSMEKALRYQERFLTDIEKVLQGNVMLRDTQPLRTPKLDNIDD